MQFQMVHNNINVLDLARSMAFYRDALGLTECGRIEPDGGDFTIVYLTDGVGQHQLELTWLHDRTKPYDLGENEFHLAFQTDDFQGALARHREMGCVCYENPDMGIYFISDPDGYWLEIVPARK